MLIATAAPVPRSGHDGEERETALAFAGQNTERDHNATSVMAPEELKVPRLPEWATEGAFKAKNDGLPELATRPWDYYAVFGSI